MSATTGASVRPSAPEEKASLYDQEGTQTDGYPVLNASGQGPFADPDNSWLNWKSQWGGFSWSGVYGAFSWIEEIATGDRRLIFECDIELYCSENYSNTKTYFHLGNIYSATENDRTTSVNGTVSSNNGMYLGVCLTGTGLNESNLEGYPGNLTGRIINAVSGTVDVLGREISAESFDIKFRLNWDSGGGHAPISYGDCGCGAIHDTLWWQLNDGLSGTYNVTWLITIFPDDHQISGNYRFAPLIVSCPFL